MGSGETTVTVSRFLLRARRRSPSRGLKELLPLAFAAAPEAERYGQHRLPRPSVDIRDEFVQ